MERAIRVYADTSVYGGLFDEEFAAASRAFFDRVRAGQHRLVISSVVQRELQDAPEPVRSLFAEMERIAESVKITDEATRLQEAYLANGIVGANCEIDALHVALATHWQCAIIVSWNFKHIVNFRKIPLYNGVNLSQGYGTIAIHTPSEVIDDEEKI